MQFRAMNCRRCQAPLFGEVAFCPLCGWDQSQAAPSAPKPTPATAEAGRTDSPPPPTFTATASTTTTSTVMESTAPALPFFAWLASDTLPEPVVRTPNKPLRWKASQPTDEPSSNN